MGWFWADASTMERPTVVEAPRAQQFSRLDPSQAQSGCPVRHKTVDAFKSKSTGSNTTAAATPPSSCPIAHDSPASPDKKSSIFSSINPLNYMFRDLSNDAAPRQSYRLPTQRETSSIPKAESQDAGSNWEYPSPQQMYNALLRKGYDDTDVTAVEDMVAVHNFLNEGAWREVLGWEARFANGLWKGFRACCRGEENTLDQLRMMRDYEGEKMPQPSLIRFQGRPKDMTPKAAMWQVLAKVYPDGFGVEPPFDRHDWFVARNVNGQTKEIRYVIDYYSGPPEATGEPVFYLDVRPAVTPTGAAERMIRWGTDFWWRATGGEVREATKLGDA